jgi:hypothetical protein
MVTYSYSVEMLGFMPVSGTYQATRSHDAERYAVEQFMFHNDIEKDASWSDLIRFYAPKVEIAKDTAIVTHTHPHYTNDQSFPDGSSIAYAPLAPTPDTEEMANAHPRLMMRFPSRTEGAGSVSIFVAPQGQVCSGWVIGLCPPVAGFVASH